jgi:polysaccharide biosynthesis/export protein
MGHRRWWSGRPVEGAKFPLGALAARPRNQTEGTGMRIAYLLGAAALVVMAGRLPAQKAYEPIGINDAVQPSNQINPDDLLSVSVYGAPELSRKVRVGADGCIHLPLLSTGVKAAGMIPERLEASIAEAYSSAQILVKPSVSVAVLEYTSRPISVAGAVRRPLTFGASGKVTLLSAITRAEGLTAEAGPDIVLTRPAGSVPPSQTIKVKELMDGKHPELNFTLQGGEEVRIAESPKVFVAGNVRKPGSYSIQDSADLTVMKLIALAGGSLPYTAREAYIYRQGPQEKSKIEIPFDLRSMIDRKSPDMALQENDMLYVVDNKNRRVALTALDRIAGFGTSTVSGLLIWRH